ncbi:unnamed protein product [Caenorhabditis auriculariae]|uniref:Uncharacterized protein n=1 Tax=Caenorhabditis auriculariae TaxID=2777116 RepID=A0A8S1HJD5_9PELO|nr:unnamed protein product [Caenorhabditis auriculariae]
MKRKGEPGGEAGCAATRMAAVGGVAAVAAATRTPRHRALVPLTAKPRQPPAGRRERTCTFPSFELPKKCIFRAAAVLGSETNGGV